MTIEIRSIYDGKNPDQGIKCGKSHTKQEFKEECDINNILKRYENDGLLPDMIKVDPQYGDFSNVASYQEACNITIKAQEQFLALSAKVRAKFNHDPAEMLAFVANPKNKEELVELGLAVKAPVKDAGGVLKPQDGKPVETPQPTK